MTEGSDEELLRHVLSLGPARRRQFLERLTEEQPERARRLRERVREDPTPQIELATGGALAWFTSAQVDAEDQAGQTVGRYRLVRKAGSGGMGVVWEARDEKLERTVALKITRRSVGDDASERFLREARAAAALNHPHIVAIYDFGEHDGSPYLVMEWMAGGTLEEHPPRDLPDVIAQCRQICAALGHAHEIGIVHRDLKPSNVLIAEHGNEETGLTVKLGDLGIALTRRTDRITATGAIAGTPSFMSPEQALGEHVDGRADLYSLGTMLYLWVTGRPPFEGEDALAIVSQHIHAPVIPPSSIVEHLQPGVDDLVLKLLEKSPDDRFADAGQVLEALDQLADPPDGRLLEAPASRDRSEGRVGLRGLVRGRLIGRSESLGELVSLFRGLRQPRIVLVGGEPGIGKSRLAREVAAAARIDGALVLAGDCYENEAVLPYLPFVQAIGSWVVEQPLEVLQHRLGDTAPILNRLAPEIGARLGPFAESVGSGGQEERIRLFDAVARLLRSLAGDRRLLMILDDMQWSDHGSVALLQSLLRRHDLGKVLVLATFRSAELPPQHPFARAAVDWERDGVGHVIELERLDADQTAEMVRTLLDQEEISQELLRSVHEETEGNPFFVEEIVKALIAEGRLLKRDLAWQHRRTGTLTLPHSLKSAISGRLSRISEGGLEALRRAAVLGKVFDYDELVSVTDFDEEALLDALDEAVAAQLLTLKRGTIYAFSHDKIREVLYEELNPVRRRRIHARIAEGLMVLREKGTAVRVEDLAYHFVASGDHQNGLRFASEAATAARDVFAYREAIEMLESARTCAEALGDTERQGRVLEELGDTFYQWGDIQASTTRYEQALELETDRESRTRIQAKAAEVYATAGEPRGRVLADEALESLRAERDTSAETDPRIEGQARMVKARYLHLEGSLSRAASLFEEALDLVAQANDPFLMIRLLSFMSGTLQHLARFDDSDAAAERAIEVGEREDIQIGRAFGHEFLQENCIYRGWWRETIAHGEAEEEIATGIQAGERVLWSHFRAYALLEWGRVHEAEEMFRAAAEESERLGESRLALFMQIGRAACDSAQGRFEVAAEALEGVLQRADTTKLVGHRITARSFLTAALMRLGPHEQPEAWRRARRESEQALALTRASESHGLFLYHGATFLEALVVGGTDEDESWLQDVRRHEDLAMTNRADVRLAENARARAVRHQLRGEGAAALEALGRAIELLESSESRIALARALRLRHEMRPDPNDLRRAESILAELGVARGTLEAEAGLLAGGDPDARA